MMISLNESRRGRMITYAVQFQDVIAVDLLPHLTCLPRPRRERIECQHENRGQIAAANELNLTLVKYDNWFEQLIPALRKLGCDGLADKLDDPVDEQINCQDGCSGGQPDERPSGPNDRPKQKGKAGTVISPHQQRNRPKNEIQSAPADSSSATGVMKPKVTGKTQYSQLPCSVMQVLRRLDVLSPVGGNDWMGLAGQLGFSVDAVQRMKSQQSPTEALLNEWSSELDATLGKLMESLRAIGRVDVCQQLEDLLVLQPEARADQTDSSAVNSQTTASSNQMQITFFSNPVPHQPKTTPSAEAPHSEPAGRSQIDSSDCSSAKPGDDSNTAKVVINRSEETSSSLQQSAETSHTAKSSGEAVAGRTGSEAEKESVHPRNTCNAVRSKDKFVYDIRSESQNTASQKPSDDLKSMGTNSNAPVSQTGSHMPVNNLNRNHQEANQNVTGSLECDVNCTGKTLLSRDPDVHSSSRNNSGSGICDSQQGFSPDDYIGPLRTNESMDDEIGSLLLSESSCSTLVGSGDNATSARPTALHYATAPDSLAASAILTSAAKPFPSPVATPTAASSVAMTTAGGRAVVNSSIAMMQMSSKGAPIQQPTGTSTYTPDAMLMIPSIDGTFIKDDLITAANPTHFESTSSQQVSSGTQQEQALDTRQSAESIQHKPGEIKSQFAVQLPRPTAQSDQDYSTDDPQQPGTRNQEASGGIKQTSPQSAEQTPQPGTMDTKGSFGTQQVQTSPFSTQQSARDTQYHSCDTQSPATVEQVNTQPPLPSSQQHGTTNQEASGGIQQVQKTTPQNTLQSTNDTQHMHPCDTQSNPCDTQSNPCDTQSNPCDTQSQAAIDQVQLPLPSAQDEDDPADNLQQQPGDENDAGAAAELEGRRTLVGIVALAVPVVLSLTAALAGGDWISNAF